MSSYSCSDCKEGELIVDARSVEVAEDETIQIVDGTAIITKIVCSNSECSSHAATKEGDVDETEETSGAICGKNGCPKPAGHMGRCRKPAEG